MAVQFVHEYLNEMWVVSDFDGSDEQMGAQHPPASGRTASMDVSLGLSSEPFLPDHGEALPKPISCSHEPRARLDRLPPDILPRGSPTERRGTTT